MKGKLNTQDVWVEVDAKNISVFDKDSFITGMGIAYKKKSGHFFTPDEMEELKKECQIELIQALKDCKDCINWMWENLHLPHTSDHFNIPANTLEGIDIVLEKFKPNAK